MLHTLERQHANIRSIDPPKLKCSWRNTYSRVTFGRMHYSAPSSPAFKSDFSGREERV